MLVVREPYECFLILASQPLVVERSLSMCTGPQPRNRDWLSTAIRSLVFE